MRTSLQDIISYIKEDIVHTNKNDFDFSLRFTGSVFDDVTGLMLFDDRGKKDDSISDLRKRLTNRNKVFVNTSSESDEKDWKLFVIKNLRQISKGGKDVNVLDIGNAVSEFGNKY